MNFVAQSAVSADGSKKGATNLIAGPITGGTGKFLGIRGMLRFAASFDPKSGFNESKGEIDYWMEAMMTSSPDFQLAGIATLCLAVSCRESMTRSTSSKFRPVVIG